jgi:hypothetical protein
LQPLPLRSIDEPGFLELVDALPEDTRGNIAATRLQGAERLGRLAELPEDAEGPASIQQIE